MADSRFRHYPVYVRNRKVAEMNAVAYDIESGDELQFGAEGVLGVSEGIPTVKLEGDCVIPVAGMKIDIISMLLSKQNVSVGIRVNGAMHKFTGHCTSANFSSSSRNGEARGKFVWIGGAPDVI